MPTDIEWADETWNPIIGCSHISAGCRNCYAERMAHRHARMGRTAYQEVVTAAGRWTGTTRFVESALDAPRHWTRKPRRVFLGSMTDIFHPSVRPEWIDRVLEVIAACPMHTFLALTKRASSIDPKLYDTTDQAPVRVLGGGDTLPNLHLGVSIENQTAANLRLPHLLELAAAGWTTYVSTEPLLAPISFRWAPWAPRKGRCMGNHLDGLRPLAGVIVGGESGPGARPMHPDWPRSIRDQCAAAGVPFFFKQWGAWEPFGPSGGGASQQHCWNPGASVYDLIVMGRVGKKAAGRRLDGRTHDDLPQPRKDHD